MTAVMNVMRGVNIKNAENATKLIYITRNCGKILLYIPISVNAIWITERNDVVILLLFAKEDRSIFYSVFYKA